VKVILAGGNKVTFNLANALIMRDLNVVIINKDRELCEIFSRSLKATVIHADATQPETLKKAEIFPNDILVALTPMDQDNLIISQLALKVFHMDKVFTLLNNPRNKEMFTAKLHLPHVISMTDMLSSNIDLSIAPEEVRTVMSFEEGKIELMQIQIQPDSPACNMALKDIDLPTGAIVGFISGRQEPFVPNGETEILPGDLLWIMTLPLLHSEVVEVLTGIKNK